MTNYLNLFKTNFTFDPFVGESSTENRIGLNQILTKIAFWHTRSRQRAQLMELETRLLKDIGLTAREAKVEASKPFWMD